MENTRPLSIVKPSFWSSRWEIRDPFGALIGRFALTGMWGNKAEGDARGRYFRFVTKGWEGTRAEMTDMSGQQIATLAPVNFWGTKYTLTYAGKEYVWKPNAWTTKFSLCEGEKEIVRVHYGGYFKPGSITMGSEVSEKDVLPLVLFGLFYAQVYAAQTGAGAAGAT